MREIDMDSTKDAVFRALRTVNYPGFTRDIVSFGLVHGVLIEGTTARIGLVTAHLPQEIQQEIAEEATRAALTIPGIEDVLLQIGEPPQSKKVRTGVPTPKEIPGIFHVVAVASGKGGVGKSTIAVNLAATLAKSELWVGLLDADIHGPNIPRMLGLKLLPPAVTGKILPAEVYGIKAMSLAFAGDDAPAIWRGPMIDKAIQQFLHDVAWGELDILVVDLPPGTGDAQLSLTQHIPVDGTIIISTPQLVAVDDARKGIAMFQKVGVPVLGLVENMSHFRCPDCGGMHYIFGQGGTTKLAAELNLPLLAEIPLEPLVREDGDSGLPAVLDPNSTSSRAFHGLAEAVGDRLGIFQAMSEVM